MYKKLLPDHLGSVTFLQNKFYPLNGNSYLQTPKITWLYTKTPKEVGDEHFRQIVNAINRLDPVSFHRLLILYPGFVDFKSSDREYIFGHILSKWEEINTIKKRCSKENISLVSKRKKTNKVTPQPTSLIQNGSHKLLVIFNLYFFATDFYLASTTTKANYKKKKRAKTIEDFLLDKLDYFCNEALGKTRKSRNSVNKSVFLCKYYPELADYFKLLMKKINKLSIMRTKHKKSFIMLSSQEQPVYVEKDPSTENSTLSIKIPGKNKKAPVINWERRDLHPALKKLFKEAGKGPDGKFNLQSTDPYKFQLVPSPHGSSNDLKNQSNIPRYKTTIPTDPDDDNNDMPITGCQKIKNSCLYKFFYSIFCFFR
ncbi:hypothetical protein ACFLZV_00020 [Candidatus Margulisiibacteriota bacterium]